MSGVIALIVTGGEGLLGELGGAEDAALTTFAGRYRFIDFALTALVDAELASIQVVAPHPAAALRAHLAAAARGLRFLRRPLPVRMAGIANAGSRAERALGALGRCRHLLRADAADVVVVATADHVLQLDVRALVERHRRLGTDVTLCAVPASDAPARGRPALEVSAGAVRAVTAASGERMALVWTGDMVVSAGALPALCALSPALRGGDVPRLEALAAHLRVGAYDAADVQRGAFWHDPRTIEEYYETQMDLCTPRPALDLHDATWAVRPAASRLGPAKVVADAAGRPGQALNSLVSDGALVRGGVVVNTVLGHGVLVESGAEIEDSVLLDGCRVGRGARVRRAVVGVGAVIGDAGEVGYDHPPAPPARMLPSGLTIVPAMTEPTVAAAAH